MTLCGTFSQHPVSHLIRCLTGFCSSSVNNCFYNAKKMLFSFLYRSSLCLCYALTPIKVWQVWMTVKKGAERKGAEQKKGRQWGLSWNLHAPLPYSPSQFSQITVPSYLLGKQLVSTCLRPHILPSGAHSRHHIMAQEWYTSDEYQISGYRGSPVILSQTIRTEEPWWIRPKDQAFLLWVLTD